MSTEPPAPLTEDERIATPDGHGVPASTAESRSWDDAVEFLRLVLTARNDPERDVEITDAMLAELASEIAADADKMDGPMPEEVERFVRTYAGSV